MTMKRQWQQYWEAGKEDLSLMCRCPMVHRLWMRQLIVYVIGQELVLQ